MSHVGLSAFGTVQCVEDWSSLHREMTPGSSSVPLHISISKSKIVAELWGAVLARCGSWEMVFACSDTIFVLKSWHADALPMTDSSIRWTSKMLTFLFFKNYLVFSRWLFSAKVWHWVIWYPTTGTSSARASWSWCRSISFPTAFPSSTYIFWTISVLTSFFTSDQTIPFIDISKGSAWVVPSGERIVLSLTNREQGDA